MRKTKLSLTDKISEQDLESLKDYMIRKIIWAKEQFIMEKKVLLWFSAV